MGETRRGWGGSLRFRFQRLWAWNVQGQKGERWQKPVTWAKGPVLGKVGVVRAEKKGFAFLSFSLPSTCASWLLPAHPPFSRRVAGGAGSQVEGLSSPEKWLRMKQCIEKHFLVFIPHPKCFLTSDPTLRNSTWRRRKAGHRRSWGRAPRSGDSVRRRWERTLTWASCFLSPPLPVLTTITCVPHPALVSRICAHTRDWRARGG